MKKWMKRIAIALAVLVAALGLALVVTALRSERPVGFQHVRARVPGGEPFTLAIWYPTTASARPTTLLGMVLMSVAPGAAIDGSKLPMVVISHGNAGGPGSHADLAMALAGAGFIVAAPMHNGDNYIDQTALSSRDFMHQRSRQLRQAVDYMLAGWSGAHKVDRDRIGVYGFSAGGMTVLTSIGGQPDGPQLSRHCAASSEFACAMLKKVRSPMLSGDSLGAPVERDPRIRAAVVAAPGLGFAITQDSLASVRIPVQLWHADGDGSVPYESNAKRVFEGLGARAELHRVADAGHFAFLVPCALAGPPLLCADKQGFDREAFHAEMNARVIAFFLRVMPA